MQFSNHLAEISVPWQLVPKETCDIGQHAVCCMSSSFFFFFFLNEHGYYAAKLHSKLIVFGSAVFDDIRNHIASVVFESVNIFLWFFCWVFLYLQMITFSTFSWVWAQSLKSLSLVKWSLNPNTWIPIHLFGFCPCLSGPTPPCSHPASPYQVWSHCRTREARLWMVCSPSSPGWSRHSQAYCL